MRVFCVCRVSDEYTIDILKIVCAAVGLGGRYCCSIIVRVEVD